MQLRRGPRAAALAVLLASMIIVAGCGSSSKTTSSSSGSGSSSTAAGSTTTAAAGPTPASDTATATLINKVYGVPTNPSSIPPAVKQALQVAAAPISPTLMSKFMSCLGQTVCVTGYPNAKYVIGLPIDDSTNTINRQGQAISLLQALRYPTVAKILMPDGQGNAQTINSNFRSLLSQNVNAIISNFGNGATMAAVGRQATQQGVLVSALNQNISGLTPGKTNIFIGNNLCQYGQYQAKAAIAGTGKQSGGSYTLLTGTPGNPYAAGWQPCAASYLKSRGWTQASSLTTNWTPQGTAQAASALISSGKNPDAILYDQDCTVLAKAYLSAGKKPPVIAGAGVAPSCVQVWAQAQKSGKAFVAYTGNAQVWNYNVGVTAAIERLEGQTAADNIPLALPLIPFTQLVKNEPNWTQYPAAAVFQSTLPLVATKKLLGG
jgi:ABC-type sugar transport system substrate-binding protein